MCENTRILRIFAFLLVSWSAEAQQIPTTDAPFREAYFNGSAHVQLLLRQPLSLRGRHIGLSFRSCVGGPLFSQQARTGVPGLSLVVRPEGLVLVVLSENYGRQETVLPAPRLLDNRWHTVEIVDRLGNVTLSSPGHGEVLVRGDLTSPEDNAATVAMIGGDGFVGCILEGPSLVLNGDAGSTKGVNVEWGPCPMTHNSCHEVDYCFNEPCMRHGTCVSRADRQDYECLCAPRYSGKNCDKDNGSPCIRDGVNPCRNDGHCREDHTGNYQCVCEPGFSGRHCEIEAAGPQACLMNPCQNNGTCLTLPGGGQECQCTPGFTGYFCQEDINECLSNPCQNGGVCDNLVNGYKCHCMRTGYEGTHCEINVDECKNAPCLNQGSCYDTYGSYMCQCAPGFGGQNCEFNLDECISSPCQHGGTCRDLIGSYECLCTTDYTGFNCERLAVDTTLSSVTAMDSDLCGGCPSNSVCVPNTLGHLGPQNICVCQPGYQGTPPSCTAGDTRSLPPSPCSSSPCAHGGACQDTGPYTFNCSCAPGYSGAQCELSTPASLHSTPAELSCYIRACMNGGTCNGDPPQCVCPEKWTGAFCERQIRCSDAPCQNMLACKEYLDSYFCECLPGWTGTNCELNRNDCVPEQCHNGATCVDGTNNFTCVCPPGFSGSLCQLSVDECLSNPCMNGGSCIDRVDGYSCNCTENFMGERCELPFNPCASSTCRNGATCVAQPNRGPREYYCECVSGYEGLFCENNKNDCQGVMCQEDRVCVDLVNGYECRCKPGYTGENCTVDIDHCEDQPCKNNGTCKDYVGNYTCHCPAGYTGRHCEEDVDECQIQNLCNYGICVNSIGSYQCFCRPGFSGDHCDLDFDECLSRPCLNGAKCENKINGFNCVCTPGYTGKECGQNINECESNPCQNGSTCIDAIASFTCACPPGITGVFCEINIDECDSSPCEHGGVCIDGVNSYHCECEGTGYEGPNCEHNIDDCAPMPCRNGGQCRDLVNDYACDCFPAYTGKNCETDIAECESQPCQHNGTCLELSDQKIYEDPAHPHRDLLPAEFSYENAAGFVCACVEGTTGSRCETNIDECESSPCMHGTCKDGIASYRCDCEKGYEGIHCELDVDECASQPCIHGTCVDGRADYRCDCDAGYGGRNCSVELLGCQSDGNTCHNGGTCLPWLLDETNHKFNCTCPRGFHGKTCRRRTTLSFAGPSSYVEINTARDEGYDISFRFRTTLSDGLLVVGQGYTIYLLELVGGRLNLHTNLLNKYEGVFIGSGLNDSEWKNVFVSINSSHLVLSATDEQSIYPINPDGLEAFSASPSARNSNPSSFPTTKLGGPASFLRKSPSFVGCMEDVVVNGKWLLPTDERFEAETDTEDQGDVASAQMFGIQAGCPRTEQCVPNPCHSGGVCTDLWREFKCACQRPFLGHTCQYNMTAATFGHENASEGHVTVILNEEGRRSFRFVTSVSMFVRTRQAQGSIFHLGPSLGGAAESADETVIAAYLEGGELVVRVQLNNTPEPAYSVGGARLDDGNSHLIQVVRNNTLVEVRINGTEYFKKTISSAGPLIAQVLYLGGMPPRPAASAPLMLPATTGSAEVEAMTPAGLPGATVLRRTRRQIAAVAASQTITNGVIDGVLSPGGGPSALTVPGRAQDTYPGSEVFFKGVIQDVQISNGSDRMVVQFFPLQATDVQIPPSLGEVSFSKDSVLEGVVSDDSCVGQPCLHDGKCRVTWNDFVCDCPAGYKGKSCDEMEFCQLQDCPLGSECRNLDEGYECIANATFDGSNWSSPLVYSVKNHDEDDNWWGNPELRVRFRTKTGGTLVYLSQDHDHLRLYVLDNGTVHTDYNLESKNANVKVTIPNFNGDWLTAMLKLEEDSGLLVLSLFSTDDNVLVSSPTRRDAYDLRPHVTMSNWKRLLRKGTVTIAGSEGLIPQDGNDVDHNVLQAPKTSFPYKGCLGTIRISGILVPFFSAQQLNASNLVTSRHFLTEPTDALPPTGCELCFNADCQHGGTCRDPVEYFECTCPPGYRGDACQEDINECLEHDHTCQNNATCVDGIANYTCLCTPGFTGWHCDEEIDECASSPCMNNGTCHDLLATFSCDCPEEFVGERCEQLKRITCENMPCHNQAACADIRNAATGDNFTCTCSPGYVGVYCERAFCQETPCLNSGHCEVSAPPQCVCAPGFQGPLCETDIDECASNPCQHGGRCSNLVAAFICNCTATGYEGVRCEKDVDECEQAALAGIEPCGAGVCENQPGTFSCRCQNDSFCGLTCSEPNPCLDEPCQNEAACTPVCTTDQNYTCECPLGFTGHNCDVFVDLTTREDDDGPNLALIITPIVCLLVLIAAVGLAVFLSLARKKRATRGTYSPSQQEYCNPRVELDNVLKPPPEERLI